MHDQHTTKQERESTKLTASGDRARAIFRELLAGPIYRKYDAGIMHVTMYY